MKTYFGYVRVSTLKQGAQGVSLIEQKAAIERYAAKNGLEIIDWFEERETAAKRGRPVFSRMLSLLRREKARGVVIHKIDRSARNLKDWADLGELIDSGVDVHFAADALDLNSRGGRLSADIQAVVAADYIRNLREETRKGFYGRLKQGLYPIGAPLGYLDCGRGKPKTTDPVRAPLIAWAFSAYASGAYSLATLCAELHRRGLRNRRGGPVSRNGLSKILNNPFYTGIIRLRTTEETFQGVHEPLISTDLYQSVQDRLAGKLVDRVQTHDHLFRRLLRCASCNRSLLGSRHKNRVYYRCQNRDCPTTCIREDRVIAGLQDVLDRIQLTPAELRDARLRIDGVLAREVARQAERREAVELLIGAAKTKCDRLTDLYLEGDLPKDAYIERRETLLFELAGLENDVREIEAGDPEVRADVGRVLELLKAPVLAFDRAIPAKKRLLVEELTSNRLVSGKNLAITLFEPFLTLANLSEKDCCDPCRDKPRTLADWVAKRIEKTERRKWMRRKQRRCPLPPPSPP